MKHLEPIIHELFQKISQRDKPVGRPLMINISGCMGSGKSTYANILAKEFETNGIKVTHVSEDDFLQPRAFRESLNQKTYDEGTWAGKTYWEVHENWLRLDLMSDCIKALKNNQNCAYHPYERSLGDFSNEEKKVSPSEVVIFETSIFSELFDIVVLIEVNEKILIDRKLSRDADLRSQEKIIDYHTRAQWPFWLRYKPSSPTFTINNNDMENPELIG